MLVQHVYACVLHVQDGMHDSKKAMARPGEGWGWW